MHLRPRLASILVCALILGACTGDKPPAASPEPAATPTDASSEPADASVSAAELGKELPPELVAELRLTGSDSDGRLVTLAPGFIATAACSDCGAPSYLWFLAVRCTDTRHCEVLTEQCEGKISREADGYLLEFRPIEADAAEICSGYTGSFELP